MHGCTAWTGCTCLQVMFTVQELLLVFIAAQPATGNLRQPCLVTGTRLQLLPVAPELQLTFTSGYSSACNAWQQVVVAANSLWV